jgi:hypothetical protein
VPAEVEPTDGSPLSPPGFSRSLNMALSLAPMRKARTFRCALGANRSNLTKRVRTPRAPIRKQLTTRLMRSAAPPPAPGDQRQPAAPVLHPVLVMILDRPTECHAVSVGHLMSARSGVHQCPPLKYLPQYLCPPLAIASVVCVSTCCPRDFGTSSLPSISSAEERPDRPHHRPQSPARAHGPFALQVGGLVALFRSSPAPHSLRSACLYTYAFVHAVFNLHALMHHAASLRRPWHECRASLDGR